MKILHDRRWGLIGLSIPGIVAIFLPFAEGVSPLVAVRTFGGRFLDFSMFGAPCFLAIPILVWQIRKLGHHRPKLPEIVVVYVLATAALTPVLVMSFMSVSDLVSRDAPPSLEQLLEGWPLYVSWAAVATNLALLGWNRKRCLTRDAVAEAFMLGAYLPNAFLCLGLFGFSYGFDIGGYVVMVTCFCYVLIVTLELLAPSAERVLVPQQEADTKVPAGSATE